MRQPEAPVASPQAQRRVGRVALAVVPDRHQRLLEIPRKELDHPAQRSRPVVGRGRPFQDVDRAHQPRIDERGRHPRPALGDDPHAGDQRQHPLTRDAAQRVGLEDPALAVLGHRRDLGHQLGERLQGGGLGGVDHLRGNRDRRVVRLAAGGRDADLLVDLLLRLEHHRDRPVPGLDAQPQGAEARMADHQLDRRLDARHPEGAARVAVGRGGAVSGGDPRVLDRCAVAVGYPALDAGRGRKRPRDHQNRTDPAALLGIVNMVSGEKNGNGGARFYLIASARRKGGREAGDRTL